MRIISLVPSITELLFDLGLANQIIGRTKFCVHPISEVKKIPPFGGTKNVHIDKVLAVKPDLIIANKEENLKTEIETLQKLASVLVTDVSTLEENNAMIREIGFLTHTQKNAEKIIVDIQNAFEKLPMISEKPKALYLIWKDPYMSVGNDTFIHEMLNYAGFENVYAHQTRYPEVIADELIDDRTPAYVLLSSEPFPFKEKHIAAVQEKFPNAKILLVDGEMFSWYGSRMRLAPLYFKDLRKML